MFTRFATPRPPLAAPVSGPFASVVAHAALVVLAVGGGGTGDGSAAMPGGEGGRGFAGSGGARAGTEHLIWVGSTDGMEGAPTDVPGTRAPLAYVVPGRGAPREGRPTPGADLAAGRRTDATPADRPLADEPAPKPASRRASVSLPDLPWLAPLPDVDAALLVAGVVASAPDPHRVVEQGDFRRLVAADVAANLFADPTLATAEALLLAGRVDDPPVALVTNPRPSYPAILAQARVGGRVLVQFRIDSAGVVDLGSLQVLQSSNALFTEAVQSVLPRLRFMPAQIGRHAVGITVRQPFIFRVRPGA